MEIREIAPGGDESLARALLTVQHAAYAVEAAIIGDDRIPPLHETLDEVRAAPLRWLGAFQEHRLIAAIGWSQDDSVVDIERLVVDPAVHRRGAGRALVGAVLASAGHRRAVVATGRDNRPARRLYEGLGFVRTGEVEVIPGLWITQYAHPPTTALSAKDTAGASDRADRTGPLPATVPSWDEALAPRQRALLRRWLPGATLVRDHSWGLVATRVIEVSCAGSRFIVKAGAADDSHIERELHAHRNWLRPWTDRGRAPMLVHGSAEDQLLVTRYLPGVLVLGTAHADQPDTYRQAGDLLAPLHAQSAVVDDDYERRENERSLAWLDRPHRIAASTVARLRAEIADWPTPPSTLVPTHGDWQPRNWLVHDGVVSIIDFGRAALRPALTDFARLAVQDFRRDPRLEAAFLDGYGADPREADAWYRTLVRAAIGTAAWAHQVGDESFEAQGHRMLAEVLAVA
ncbi:GNAT family N-acetyltransferase [Verrucosispora sp. ts21]|uniref:GNAT family N-acetyltransferase n=1 Tax=Verrucosispora sp. ts21 TaxID=2069341 RepID=UPI001304F81D|nr:GNAT family N-acetyltransferase [Verrucosispora sp. ts21]